MSLVVLQRACEDLCFVAACSQAEELAHELSKLQPFKINVFAELPAKADVLPAVQDAMRAYHIGSNWYKLSPSRALQLICTHIDNAGSISQESEQSNNEQDKKPYLQVLDPSWHALLEVCPKEQADRATIIRRTLKKTLGSWQAASVLSAYKEVCIRIGPPQRYFINSQGHTLRLADAIRDLIQPLKIKTDK